MSIGKSIIKNTAWLFIAEIISVILLTIGNLFLIRSLGDVTYGQYGFIISFVALLSFIIDFGLPILLVNEVSQDKSQLKKYLSNFFSLKILLGIVSLAILFILISFTNKSGEINFLVILWGFNAVIISFTSLIHGVFRIFEQMKFEAYFKILTTTVNIVVIILIITMNLSLRHLVIYTVIASSIILLTILIFVHKKFVPFRFSIDKKFLIQIFKKSIPLSLSMIFISIYFSIDTVMLSFFKGDEAVGWYSADYRIVLPILTFIGLYYSVLFPIISRLAKTDVNKIKLIMQNSAKIMILFFLPTVFTISFLAKPIVILLFGTEFSNGQLALAILIWTIFISSISMMFSSVFLAFGKRKIHAIATALGAVINVVLNLVIIPKYSLNGAAVTTVISELAILIFFFYVFKKQFFHISIFRYVVKPIICTLIIAPIIYFLFQATSNVIITIIITASIYTALIIIFKGVTINEIKQIWNYLLPNKANHDI